MAQIYWPVNPSRITEGYGWADWRQGIHDGIDFGIAQGTPLRATASGTIRNNDAGQKDGAGVDITTPDGWKVRHWHVSKFLLPNGFKVEAGDVIALTGGAPGTWGAGFSTGAHLHWGTQVAGKWVDPATLNPLPFGATPTPTRKKKSMSTLYYDTEAKKWALAGDGNKDAAWLETLDNDLANAWSIPHGQNVFLSHETFEYFKKLYLGK